ncbi:MAG: MetQ/NlpA family ABC transporter substrate-binding protein [Solimonas sp.]
MKLRPLSTAILAAALLLTGFAARAEDRKDITIGTSVGEFADMARQGFKPWLEQRGYKVKVVEFSDYVQPNLALAQGAIDANIFQHEVYLRKFAADRGLQLTPIAQVPTAPMGLYSRKHRSLAELADGARIAMPNDPTNQARALAILAKLGWVTLKPDVDPVRASEKDVAGNPRKLKLLPLEAAMLPRSLDDTDFSFVNGNYALSSGLKLSEALKLEDLGERYINVIAVRTVDLKQPFVAELRAAARSPEFKAFVAKRFPGFTQPPEWAKQ